MTSTKPILLALAVLAVSLPIEAADLLEIYRAAQGQDALFASAQAAQRAGKEKLVQGRASLLPSVNLTANSTYNDNTIQYRGTSPYNGETRYNSNGYAVTLVQPLYRQQNWLNYAESKLQVAQTVAQFKNAEQELIVRVAQAYFDVLMAQDTVQLALAQKSAIAEQLEQAKRNFEVGSATITDTHEAQARHDLVIAQEIAAQNTLEIKKSALQLLTNTLPNQLQPLGQQFKPDMPQPSDMEKWVTDAQLSNPQLAVAQAAAELSEREVARNRGGHYPTLDLVANYSNNSNNGGTLGLGSDSHTTTVGVKFDMPLFQGGATNSKWREAAANRDRAKDELENARRTVTLQTRQAYLGVVNGIAQVQALQQALTRLNAEVSQIDVILV